jgi:ketosteroid isomerase-like protein
MLRGAAFAVAAAVCAGAARAGEWSADQRAPLGTLEASIQAVRRADLPALTKLYHEKYVAWDLAQPTPVQRAEALAGEAEFIRQMKSYECQLTPLAIEVVGDTAVVQAHFRNTVVSKDGTGAVSKGRWTSTLVKTDRGWLFLHNAYVEEK